jgi:chaperonin GroES
MSSITPLSDRVLVKPVEETEQVRGGIIIPDTAKEKPQQGVIEAVGPGKRGENGKVQPMSVKAGDTVLYGKYAGTEVKIADQKFLIMGENDILGIVEK